MEIERMLVESYPTITFKELWHTGTLNSDEKQFGSHEGAGLSITTYPAEWCEITPLLCNLYQCCKTNSLFLNFHSLSEKHVQQIYQWGCELGYIENSPIYRVSWFHGDFEMDVYSDFTDREDALEEADGEEERVEQLQGYRSLPVMHERTKTDVALILLLPLLTTLFVDEVLTELDGVWWDDDLDVSILSAPRGVIALSKLHEWTFTLISE